MDNLKLVSPTAEYSDAILDFRCEVMDAHDTNAFAGCSWLEDFETAEGWFCKLDELSRGIGGVPSDTYLALRITDNRIVGIIDLRHHIDTPILSTWGGHFGYTVRPSERRKGYASEMVRLNLVNCKGRGINKVLVTCLESNIASARVIEKNGGIFESMITVDGKKIKRYHIVLN